MFFQPLQNFYRILFGRFLNFDVLEPSHKALTLFKMFLIFLVGGGSDKTDFPRGKIGLQHIGNIEASTVHRSRAYDIMDFIDIKDRLFFFHDAVHNLAEPFLKIAPVLGSCQQGSEIQGKNRGAF